MKVKATPFYLANKRYQANGSRVIGMLVRGKGGQDPDLKRQFLPYLTNQRLFRGFPRLNLPARELPQTATAWYCFAGSPAPYHP